MKQLKKLAFVMAFVMMVTLCAGAMASEDGSETRVTLTVKFVDNVTLKPANGGVKAQHACENCAVNINSCLNYDNSDGDTYVELVPGHTYLLTAINSGFYNGDPKQIEVKVGTDSKCTVNEATVEEVVFHQYIDYDPNATIELPAFKTMDGKAPGAQTFTFDIWKYSYEEFVAMEEEFASANFSSLDEAMAAYRSYHAAKKPYATATNDADGYIVFKPAVSPYDDGNDKVFAKKQELVFVAMERMEKGRPVCFDDAVYIYSTEVSLRDNGPKPEPKSMKAENREEYTGSRQELIDEGYTPCGQCQP